MKTLNTWMPVVVVALVAVLLPNIAFAAEDPNMWRGYVGLGFGLGLGLVVVGGTLGQGMAASSAFQSIARNPAAAGKLNAPFFVGMALIESLVLLGWLYFFLQQGVFAVPV